MNKGIKIFIGLLSIPLFVLGLKTMFDPTSMIEKWGMDPLGLTGLNSLRSMFPGILVGSGLMMQMGIWKKNTKLSRIAENCPASNTGFSLRRMRALAPSGQPGLCHGTCLRQLPRQPFGTGQIRKALNVVCHASLA